MTTFSQSTILIVLYLIKSTLRVSKTILILLSKKIQQKFHKPTKNISRKIGRITVILSHGHISKALSLLKRMNKLELPTALVKMLTKLKVKNNSKLKKSLEQLFHQTMSVSLSQLKCSDGKLNQPKEGMEVLPAQKTQNTSYTGPMKNF